MGKNVPMLLVFLEVNSVRFSSEKWVWLPSPPSWLKYRYQASETYFAEHPYEERVDRRGFFNLKAKPSCWLRMPWLDDSTCPPKWSCLWPCPAALQGGHESAGAVQARPCCGWVAGLPWQGSYSHGNREKLPQCQRRCSGTWSTLSAWQSGSGVRRDLTPASRVIIYYTV